MKKRESMLTGEVWHCFVAQRKEKALPNLDLGRKNRYHITVPEG
jgi:hypothetical protein